MILEKSNSHAEELFTGYVLAGGKSSRMGRDKAFLEIGGKDFVKNAVDILKPNCEQVKIVLNPNQKHFIEKLPKNISYIFDCFENRGAPGGMHAALNDCQTKFAVILAVDLPFVTGAAIGKLCKTILEAGERSAVVPRQTDGKLQPLCAVYRAKICLPEIEKILLTSKSAPARDFLKKLSVVYIQENQLAVGADLFKNINSPLDLQKSG